MNLTNIAGAVQVLTSWYNKAVDFGRVVGDNSLSDLTKEMKVQPLVIVSKECLGVEALGDIFQGLLNYTIADYMQAVSYFGKIDDIKVRRALGAFNPNRDGSAGALLQTINLESYSGAAMQFSLPMGTVVTTEAKEDEKNKYKFDTKTVQDEAKNLSVGKIVDVEFTTSKATDACTAAKTVLPIQFRLMASFMSSNIMINALASGTSDAGFFARLERATDSGISPFIDFLMAQDLIEEKRKVLFSEDGKMLTTILKRAAANKRAAIASRTPSLNNLANIFVITESEAKELEAKFAGKLDQERVRERIFRNVFASTLVVIDRSWNRVTFWHRGMDTEVSLDFKQLKAAAQGKGPDLMDMLKSFNLGAPVF